ncbi:chromate transporter [Psychrobacillus sp. FSL H8-0484]|uniref:chromate transporter n=1 Tax=Psychrobacillus sp. FSL H8-0484 TaxID=2921390 RepID=UPI0030FC1E3A
MNLNFFNIEHYTDLLGFCQYFIFEKLLPGAIASTLGMFFPSLLIILLIAKFFFRFNDNKYVKSVCGLLSRVYRRTLVDWSGGGDFCGNSRCFLHRKRSGRCMS